MKNGVLVKKNVSSSPFKACYGKVEQAILGAIPGLAMLALGVLVIMGLLPIFNVWFRQIVQPNVGTYVSACLAGIGVILTALLVHRRSVDEFTVRHFTEMDYRREQKIEARRLHLSAQRAEFSKQLSDTARQFGSKEPIVQASAVTGLLLQIDAWYQLELLEKIHIQSEKRELSSALLEERITQAIYDADCAALVERLSVLRDESRRKRQELFFLAFRGTVREPSREFFLSRCAGFIERIRDDAPLNSFTGINIVDVNLGATELSELLGKECVRADFSNVKFTPGSVIGGDFRGADFTGAGLEDVTFVKSNFAGANLRGTSVQGANFSDSMFDEHTSFAYATYDAETVFPVNFLPDEHFMIFFEEEV